MLVITVPLPKDCCVKGRRWPPVKHPVMFGKPHSLAAPSIFVAVESLWSCCILEPHFHWNPKDGSSP